MNEKLLKTIKKLAPHAGILAAAFSLPAFNRYVVKPASNMPAGTVFCTQDKITRSLLSDEFRATFGPQTESHIEVTDLKNNTQQIITTKTEDLGLFVIRKFNTTERQGNITPISSYEKKLRLKSCQDAEQGKIQPVRILEDSNDLLRANKIIVAEGWGYNY